MWRTIKAEGMTANFLLVLFDESKLKVPHNAMQQYVDKATWQHIQNEIVKEITVWDTRYAITGRSSFLTSDWTCKTMILVLDIRKIN